MKKLHEKASRRNSGRDSARHVLRKPIGNHRRKVRSAPSAFRPKRAGDRLLGNAIKFFSPTSLRTSESEANSRCINHSVCLLVSSPVRKGGHPILSFAACKPAKNRRPLGFLVKTFFIRHSQRFLNQLVSCGTNQIFYQTNVGRLTGASATTKPFHSISASYPATCLDSKFE